MKKKKLLKKLLKLEAKKLEKLESELQALKQIVEEGFASSKYDNEYTELVTMYTDASYDQNADICAYGIVAIPYNGDTVDFTGLAKSPNMSIKVDNNFGEAYAVIKAIELAQEYGYNNITVYTDSTNVILWKEVGYGVNDALANWLYKRFTELSSSMAIRVNWMKRRTCDYNRAADNIAKKTLNLARENMPRRPEKLSGGRLCTLGELCDFSKLKLAE